MPKCKLVRCIFYEIDSSELTKIIDQSDDWDELSDEEYEFLKKHIYKLNFMNANNRYSHDERYVLVVQERKDVETELPDKIGKLKTWFAKEQKKLAEADKKRKDAEAKRKATAEQKKIEKAKKLLEDKGLL